MQNLLSPSQQACSHKTEVTKLIKISIRLLTQLPPFHQDMNALANNVEVTSTTTSLEDGGIPETTFTTMPPNTVPGLSRGIPVGLTT